MSASDGDKKFPLPVLILILAFFFGAMKFEGFKPMGAEVAAVVLPPFVVYRGVTQLSDTDSWLFQAGLALGAMIVAAVEVASTRIFGWHHFGPDAGPMRWIFLGLGVLAALIEGIAAARSLRVRFAAWLGIALGFGSYLAGVSVRPEKDWMGTVLVGLVLGIWFGGLAGLILGGLAARIMRKPAPPAAEPKTAKPIT